MKQWLPLLVEFDPGALAFDANAGATPLKAFTALEWLGASVRDAVRVPHLFANPPAALVGQQQLSFCGLLVEQASAAQVVADPGWQSVIVDSTLGPRLELRDDVGIALLSLPDDDGGGGGGGAIATPAAPGTADAMPASASFGGGGARVAVAVIDEGIAVAHDRFLDASGARIARFWCQNGGFGTSLGPGMPGTEFTDADINAALAIYTSGGRVDELRLYEALGLLDMTSPEYKALAHRRTHGTHVLDLAAGAVTDGSRPIIAVELPEAAVADPAGSPLYLFILLGVLYVLDRADQIRGGTALPVVLNISYGPHQGPHDGSSLFERAVDQVIAAAAGGPTPLDVVLAAGNFRQSRVHALFEVDPGTPKSIDWRVQPEDRTPSHLDLWFPPGAGAGISVTVTSPLGSSVTVTPGSPLDIFVGPKGEEFRARYVPPTVLQPRPHVLVSLKPTATDPPLHPTQATSPAGLWTVDVQKTGGSSVEVEAWIWRDGPVNGRRSLGRQSYFDDPDYVRFDASGHVPPVDPLPLLGYVTRSRTLSGIGTGANPFIVGGYRRLPAPAVGTAALYSSLGPVSGGPRTRPDPELLAPSEDSIACHGVLAAGVLSGSAVAMNGTSVAAPQFARWLADQRASGTPLPPFAGAPLPLPLSRIDPR